MVLKTMHVCVCVCVVWENGVPQSNSTKGIQMGNINTRYMFLGIWLPNEAKMRHKLSLR